jgi:hypothetical protein
MAASGLGKHHKKMQRMHWRVRYAMLIIAFNYLQETFA